MTRVWRITKARHAAAAFDGRGGVLASGRWHTAGRRVVYAAEHAALAALEILGNLQDAALLRAAYVLVPAEVDEELIETVETLPEGWNAPAAGPGTQAIGDAWLAEGRSAVLRVPSAHLPLGTGWNYLLNPQHEGFGEVRVGDVLEMRFSAKLGR